ncbi:MAG TPA: 3-phosphoshikimate 1-carboxyvinyltransferase [Gemmatimonadales bacterium]|nr:3-phosphoshikimate 1-carboxyvinyltransferase [Gemmatimonadales bacterium]
MRVAGTIRVPGDKSITHRVLLLAGIGRGTCRIRGALTSLDARSTARVVRQLGAEVSALRESLVTVQGGERFSEPAGVLDCGNSGTTARLTLGLLAAHDLTATLTGDRSLRRRPMRRVTAPLSSMGARFTELNGDGLPLRVEGSSLRPLRYEMPVSSAQLKSALLLAGMAAEVNVSLREPHGRSRDHTERLLRSFGYQVVESEGWIHFTPTGKIQPFDFDIPGDISSAAFLIGAGLLADAGELRIAGVGLNPTRTAFLDVLSRMGATITVENETSHHDEPVGDLLVSPARLRPTEVVGDEIPGLIDEVPLLAILASRADGVTIFRQVGELRVKESDRLGLIAENLRNVGVRAEVQGDDLTIEGTDAPPCGAIRTAADHRLAMAFAVLGTLRGAKVVIDDLECSAVSFPRFVETLQSIQGQARP